MVAFTLNNRGFILWRVPKCVEETLPNTHEKAYLKGDINLRKIKKLLLVILTYILINCFIMNSVFALYKVEYKEFGFANLNCQVNDMAVSPDGTYVAVGKDGTVCCYKYSVEYKASWNINKLKGYEATTFERVSWAKNKFYATGWDNKSGTIKGYILTSEDGKSWDKCSFNLNNSTKDTYDGEIGRVRYEGNKFWVAFGKDFYSSEDGVNWTKCLEEIADITYKKGFYIAIGKKLYYSINGINWHESTLKDKATEKEKALLVNGYQDVLFNGNIFVCIGGNTILYSTNGNDWNKALYPGESIRFNQHAVWDGTNFIIPIDDKLLISSNGINWSVQESKNDSLKGITRLIWDGQKMLMVKDSGINQVDISFNQKVLPDMKDLQLISSEIVFEGRSLKTQKYAITNKGVLLLPVTLFQVLGDKVQINSGTHQGTIKHVIVDDEFQTVEIEEGNQFVKINGSSYDLDYPIAWINNTLYIDSKVLNMLHTIGYKWVKRDNKLYIYDSKSNFDNIINSVFYNAIGLKVNSPYAYVYDCAANKDSLIIIDLENIHAVPLNKNNKVFVPIDFVIEQIGINYTSYNSSTKTLRIESDKKVISVSVGKNTAQLNKSKVTLDAQPQLISNHVYVSINSIQKLMGYKVLYKDGVILVNSNTITEMPKEKAFELSEKNLEVLTSKTEPIIKEKAFISKCKFIQMQEKGQYDGYYVYMRGWIYDLKKIAKDRYTFYIEDYWTINRGDYMEIIKMRTLVTYKGNLDKNVKNSVYVRVYGKLQGGTLNASYIEVNK